MAKTQPTQTDKKANSISDKFSPKWDEIADYVLHVWAKPNTPEDENPDQYYAVQKDAKKYTRPGVEETE